MADQSQRALCTVLNAVVREVNANTAVSICSCPDLPVRSEPDQAAAAERFMSDLTQLTAGIGPTMLVKTTRIVEICDAFDDNYEYADNEIFDRYLQEGDERCIVFGTSYMEGGHSIFDGDGNDPVVYASFAPSQMLFKFDFWERGRAANGDPEPIDDGQGPTGEIYMAREELQTYLRWHARWSD